MKINLKQPKYVIPMLLLPFLCLFFYVYSSSGRKESKDEKMAGLNSEVGGISKDLKDRALTDKLDAYRQTYKEADGRSAINNIVEQENVSAKVLGKAATKTDLVPGSSTNLSTKIRSESFSVPNNQRNPRISEEDRAMALAISNISKNRENANRQPMVNSPAPSDPMDFFKKQMAFIDSVSKASDPDAKARLAIDDKQKQDIVDKKAILEKLVTVTRSNVPTNDFNTVMVKDLLSPIQAMIEDNITVYLGSRLRIKVLENIKVGKVLLKQGSMLYAEVEGFSAQRVKLLISSVFFAGKIIPISLKIYDLDGMEGLYVPASSFREFSKDLSSTSISGVNIKGSSANSQEFLMSTVDKIFRSGSSAISGIIKKNKAKIKYNTRVYLIDGKDNQ